MGRPPCCRRIAANPVATVFRPAGVPPCESEEIVLALDEFEAVRLADLVGLYQEQAAERMGVSRPTFSRIIDVAHRKIAEALVRGLALRIEGGPVSTTGAAHTHCPRCERSWLGPDVCPRCRGGIVELPGAEAPPERESCGCPGGRRRRGSRQGI